MISRPLNMHRHWSLLGRCVILCIWFVFQSLGCGHLSIPLVVSEQCPETLGHTVKEIETFEAVSVFAKTQFSMVVPKLEEHFETLCDGNLTSVILCGIEVSIEWILFSRGNNNRSYKNVYTILATEVLKCVRREIYELIQLLLFSLIKHRQRCISLYCAWIYARMSVG